MLDRKRYYPKQGQPSKCFCGATRGKLHRLGCPEELSPCQEHQFCAQCDCGDEV